MIENARGSKFASFVVVSLLVSLTLTPLTFSVPGAATPSSPQPERELQHERYKRIQEQRKGKQNEERDKKLQDYMGKHDAFRRDVELVVPYWAIGGGYESTLVLNNTFTRVVEVTPVVYTDKGQSLSAGKITLGKLESKTISLRNLLGVEGYGQVALRFYGEPLEIHGSIVVANATRSIAVSHPFEKRSYYSSSRLDGVFYVPSSSAQAVLAVSNGSGRSVDVAVTVRGEGSVSVRGPGRPVTLGPHETQLVELHPFLDGSVSGARAVSAVVTHSGAPGDVLVHGMTMDSTGFSANIRFLEPANVTELDLTSPIYKRGKLRPLVLLSNSGREEANVRLQAFYMLEGESHEQVLYDASVAAGAVAHVDLTTQVGQLPQDAENIGLRIVESAKRRGILADVLLVDSSGSQVLQLFPKGFAGEVHPSHGFPFRIDGSTDTIVTVANPSKTEAIDYSLHLFFEGGETYTYADTSLKPGEIKHIDLRALREKKIPGARKEILPATLTFGQGKVHFRPKKGSAPPSAANAGSHGGHHGGGRFGGVAGATIVDEAGKMSFATICAPVCPFEGYWYIEGGVGGSIADEVGATYNVDLYVTFYDFGYLPLNSFTWTNYGDSNVVEPIGGYINLVGPGMTTVEFEAQFDVWIFDCFECYYGDLYWVCPGEGDTIIPLYVPGYIDVYSYGYFVSIISLNFDGPEPENDSFTILVDGPPWATPTVRATAQREGDSDVLLMQDSVGYGPQQIAFLAQGEDPPPGTYFRIVVDVIEVLAPPEPAEAEIDRAQCSDATKTAMIREYRPGVVYANGVSPAPTCADLRTTGGTTHFTWSDYNGGFSDGNPHSTRGWMQGVVETNVESARSAYGQAVYMESGYRCPHGNSGVSGVVNSYHMQGRAVDLFKYSVIPHASWTEAQFNELRDYLIAEGAEVLPYNTYTNHHLHAEWEY